MHKTIIDGVEIYSAPVRRLKVKRAKRFNLGDFALYVSGFIGFGLVTLTVASYFHV